MLHASPYILKKGLDMSMPASAGVQRLPKGFQFGQASPCSPQQHPSVALHVSGSPEISVQSDGGRPGANTSLGSHSVTGRQAGSEGGRASAGGGETVGRMRREGGQGQWWVSPVKNGGEEREWLSDMQQAMVTGLLKGVDRHGNVKDPLAAPRPTFVCKLRQEAPFVTVKGKLVLRESDDFGDSIVTDRGLPTPQMSLEHTMQREALSLRDDVVGQPPQHRTWTVELKSAMNVPAMAEMLAHPSPTARIPRALDRRSWDGGMASSRAPEVEEIGQPMVRDPEAKKTRMAVMSNRELGGRVSAPKPSWVCWSRHQTHQ